MRRIFRAVGVTGSLLVIGAAAAACGGGGGHHRAPAGERQAERRDDAADRRTEARTGWEKLGERIVHGGADKDVIPVGRADGKFSRIMLVVEHSALEMYDVVVTFGNDETFSPEVRHVFAENSTSRVIDLPGGQRFIRSVAFKYGNLPGGGRAQIELWAQ